MSVNIKQNGELVKIANNVSIVQADWNDRENTNKNTSIKNQPETIKTMADLIACQDNNALAGAMAVVEALDYQNVARDMDGKYSTLEEFVEATNAYSGTPRIGRCHDISSTGWTNGAEPFSEGNQWYRYIIIYSASYKTGNTNDIHGNGIFWHRSKKMYNVLITGNKDTGLTLTYEVINKPTITTENDLMANTVSGLFPDALVVKNTITSYNSAKYTGESYATLEEFITALYGSNNETFKLPFKTGLLRDTGAWGPLSITNNYYQYMLVSQNPYVSEQRYNTMCHGIFIDSSSGKCWFVRIYGKKDTGLTATYKSIAADNTYSEPVKTDITSYLTECADTTWSDTYAAYTRSGNVITLSASFKYSGVPNAESTLINAAWATGLKVHSFSGFIVGYDHNFGSSIFCVTDGSQRIGIGKISLLETGKNYRLGATAIVK